MKRTALVRLFFALVAVAYFGSFPYLASINNPNENTRTYLVMALVDHGTFRLDDVVRRFGWTNDMARVPDPAAPGGTYLAAVKGPAMTYVGVPIYVAQKAVLRLFGKRPPGPTATPAEAEAWLRTTTLVLQTFAVHLPCFLFLVWLERRLRRWSPDDALRLAAVATVGLGTNYLAYSLVFVSHATSAAIVFVAIDVVAAERLLSRGDPRRARPRVALLAGFLASAITLLEYQGLFLSVVVAGYAFSIFRAPRTFAAFAVGGAANVLALMLFQWRSFGSPLTPGHRMMETDAFRALQHQGLFGITLPHPEAIVGLLFDGGYGLFGTSAFLWLAVPGMAMVLAGAAGKVERERRLELAVVAVTFVVMVLSVSAAVMWRGGWTIGPRYLGAAPALVGLLALAALVRASRRFPAFRDPIRGLAVGLAAASIVRGGAIGLVVSTLPEAIVRPVAQILVPFVRLRLMPHHPLELLGVASVWPAFLPLVAVALAWVTIATARLGARELPVALLVGALAIVPALWMPTAPDAGPEVRALFFSKWEPAGRDVLSLAIRRAAEDPCALHDVARAERLLGRVRETALAEAQATRGCPR